MSMPKRIFLVHAYLHSMAPIDEAFKTGWPQAQTVNLLDSGDLFGERTNNWDLTLRKNIRFAGKRVNFGADIYNVLNSDAATAYKCCPPIRDRANQDLLWHGLRDGLISQIVSDH